ncbi:RagB/SusD family nutrient uptake outer membrane protein [Bacteroides fragilis]|uniref:RagB/SusD family nutrient uptake outer membrane protein n=1 Tax=Bacteroides fragilis TaxID=817 RepID=UPI0022AA2B0E|nr:RagB/SusD family nutrient uptake outer membrane protein [Bacteroides fragilis]MCZ2563928.1 RagB/SusD family nutrient uptake outer membrane protein [Bacteroides fragilis]
MKKRYILVAFAAGILSLSSCSDFLDTKPDSILTQDEVYSDPNLVKSVLANFYGRITWGQRIDAFDDLSVLDEAITYDTNSDENIDRNKWRPFDYTLIRNLNQFLQGVKEAEIDETTKNAYIGEVRYIRAWTYFCMSRGLGGMPIVGDEVFDYTPGMDITSIQIPRSTEADMYDYIISECQEAAVLMSKATNTNSARANYWVAKMLEARAAITAASLATYNTEAEHPQLRTAGGEVGIPSSKAENYYRIALAAAKELIEGAADGTPSPYKLMTTADASVEAKADNFFKAVCEKNGNTEVIWTRDYTYPGQTHGFTKNVLPKSIEQDLGSSRLSALLNLVEAYEPINASEAERGTVVKFNVGTIDNPEFFDDPSALFLERDPRLTATILYPGSSFDGKIIDLQAGQLNKIGDKWVERTGRRNTYDENGKLITANNGPFGGNDEREINRTGFYIRKYLDKTPSAGTIGRGSEMWNVYFRISEAYLIAAESAWELSRNNNDVDALKYINAVRERAGIKPLTSIDHQKIMHEYQVEFAFEGHRWWDLKRWMEADNIWTGNDNDESSQRRGLWPYRVVEPNDVNDGKWVFIEKNMQTLDLYRKPLKCTDTQYYSELDNGWLNNNPKLVKNPYQ